MQPDEKAVIDEIAESCLCFRLRKLNRVVTGIYDAMLRPTGLRISQVTILVATGRLGVASRAELCRLLQMDISTLSRTVARMRKQGWLETVDEGDARSQPLRITAEGRHALSEAFDAWEEAQRQAMNLLQEEGSALLRRLNGVIDRQTAAQ